MKESPKGSSTTLLMLIATAFSFVYFLIVHGDFTLLTYPFKFPDSWDWLVDALSYLGYNVIPPVRAPMTPLTFAAMIAAGADDLIPYVGILYHHLMIPGVYVLVRAGTGCSRTALFASMLCLVNSRLLGNALYIGSDVAANTLMLYAMLFFWLGVTHNRRYLWPMSLFWAASALTQYAAFFLVFPFFGYILLCNRPLFRDSRLWGGFILAGFLASTQFVYRLIEFGDPLYSKVTHLGLVRPHFDTVGPYLWWSLGFFSPLVFMLALVGLWRVVRNPCLRAFGTLLFLMFATMGTFFVILYDWPDNRFIQYWAHPILIFAAIGLEYCVDRLRRSPVSRRPNTDHALPSERVVSRSRKHIAILLVLFTLVSGSLAGAHPFTSDMVLSPGIALVPSSNGLPLTPGAQMEVDLRWSSKRYHCFYYSHARALRGHRGRMDTLPCSFNDATEALRGLAPMIQAALPPSATIGMMSSSPSRAYWERNTLSFVTRRPVVAWQGLEAESEDAQDRAVMLVTDSERRFKEKQLIEQPELSSVLALKPGEKIHQRMILPDGTVDLELLTGTFDQEGVVIHVILKHAEPGLKDIFSGNVFLQDNEYTAILPGLAQALPGGSHQLILENRGELAGAFYINKTAPPRGWRLVGVEGTVEAGSLVARAVARDHQWNQGFNLVARSGGFWLWQRNVNQHDSIDRVSKR